MQAAGSAGRLLIIEDDQDARANLCDILEMDEYAIETANSMREALALRNLPDFEVVILDRRLPDGNALDFLPRLRELAPQAALVIVTAYSDLEGAIEALRLGAADYILKPINADSLRLRLSQLQERKRLERDKERSETLFRNLVEAAECMIVMLRPSDFSILYFSPFAERLTGYRASEVKGKSYLELLIPPGERPVLRQRYLAGLGFEPQREFDGRIVCRDGTTRDLLRNVRCLPDYEGSPALLIVGHDITELRQAQSRALLSERMAAIGQMCAGLAHESRNALQRSQACLEMLALKVADRPDAMNLIGRIQQAQDDLHRLYEDVREYAAPLNLVLRPCFLPEVWRKAWSHLEPLRRGRETRLTEDLSGVNLMCEADPFRLEQVFRNIFDNAIAAAPERVEIVVTTSPAFLNECDSVRISVRDNGPGLDPQQRERIFESFYTTKTRGTGLGMAIVKRIIEAHGGCVEVGDREGPGAEILLTLPRNQGR